MFISLTGFFHSFLDLLLYVLLFSLHLDFLGHILYSWTLLTILVVIIVFYCIFHLVSLFSACL